MKFPKMLFVRIDKGRNPGDECLIAQATEAEVIEDDGPTTVAVYAFVGSNTLGKQVVRIKTKKK